MTDISMHVHGAQLHARLLGDRRDSWPGDLSLADTTLRRPQIQAAALATSIN
ncbi:hypothetical protein [Streptomyces violaceusniger]|uniref:hypothetical protein n=1 Tax=Streptomyces violaceusniger TaxID=68280 RepID=UPI0001E4E9B7|nr:hypothetical protein [Streptomyces violaceusniger]